MIRVAVVCVIALGAACDTSPLPIADITLALRQPQGRDLLGDADAVERNIVIDGRDFGAKLLDPAVDDLGFSLTLPAGDEADEGSARHFSVSLVGTLDNDTIAFAQSGEAVMPTIHAVKDGAEPASIRLPLLFGPVGAPALLDDVVSPRRTPAVCADDAGRAWVLGGTDGVSPALADGAAFDPSTLAFSDEPIDLGATWTRGDCLIDADGVPILFGGCDAGETARNFFHAIADSEATPLFADGEVFAGCDARLRQGPGDAFWFVTPESAELRRRADGFVIAYAVLDRRDAPQAATTTQGDLILARGTDAGAALVTTTVWLRAGTDQQDAQRLAEIDGAVLADFKGARDPLALLPNGDLKSVARSGQELGVRHVRTVDLAALGARAPDQLVVFGDDDRVAILSAPDGSGDRALFIEPADADEELPLTRRDRIVRGPGQSLLLAGGDQVGVDVVMLR